MIETTTLGKGGNAPGDRDLSCKVSHLLGSEETPWMGSRPVEYQPSLQAPGFPTSAALLAISQTIGPNTCTLLSLQTPEVFSQRRVIRETGGSHVTSCFMQLEGFPHCGSARAGSRPRHPPRDPTRAPCKNKKTRDRNCQSHQVTCLLVKTNHSCPWLK